MQNVDLIRTTGVESAWQLRDLLFTGFDLQASVIYAHSRIARNTAFPASEGKWQRAYREWRGDVVASYSFLEKWDATLAARYSGRQYGQLDNSDVNDRAYTGVSRFFTIDARVRYRARGSSRPRWASTTSMARTTGTTISIRCAAIRSR